MQCSAVQGSMVQWHSHPESWVVKECSVSGQHQEVLVLLGLDVLRADRHTVRCQGAESREAEVHESERHRDMNQRGRGI